jgi:hypothetical protein
MAQRRMTRRWVLAGAGMTALGISGVGASMVADVLPGGAQLRRLLRLDGGDPGVPDVPPGDVRVERLASRARGRDVDIAVVAPYGVAAEGLPACVALHGRGSSARDMLALGLPRFLTAAIRSGIAPFALVAVDGNDAYWHCRDAGDDPQAMLRDELPGWLAARGLAPADAGRPGAALGISMGGFGALLHARARAEHPLRCVAVVSPAVFGTWQDVVDKNVFRDRADWESQEPLRHLEATAGQALGVWCGTEDPFVGAARRLARSARASVGAFAAGAHTAGYWHRVLPDVLRFVGARLSNG